MFLPGGGTIILHILMVKSIHGLRGFAPSNKSMNFRILIFLFSVSVFGSDLAGQTGPSGAIAAPGGIMLRYGMGAYALKDHYISKERYEGLLPYYAVGWIRAHDRVVYKLGFEIGQSDQIRNYNVSTRIVSFRMSQGFLYPIKPVSLFRKNFGLWLGPTTDVYYFQNNPDIAVSGFDYTNSYATLLSLGFRFDGIYTLSERFSMETTVQTSLLSLGMRSVDREEEDQSGTKLVTPASGMNATFELGFTADLFQWFSMELSYRFELTRITAWDDLLTVSNGGFLGFCFRF
jgi:hypothetical protein